MYTIQHIKDNTILEVNSAEGTVYGKIHLDKGASLQELTLQNKTIIQNLNPLKYANSYASAILFPFANRIKDGTYEYNGTEFKFDINVEEEQNALHGLVYNKTFKVVKEVATNDKAEISLEYELNNPPSGFPYSFKIQLDYNFTSNQLELKMKVTNTSNQSFPFTLGWHPYFATYNLSESTVEFDSTERMNLDSRNITTGVSQIENVGKIEFKNQTFDDCWKLNNNAVIFKTPEYDLKISTTGKNNFLQIYTPPIANVVAIEPTTGVSDSFNNNIGLQILAPQKTQEITWGLTVENSVNPTR